MTKSANQNFFPDFLPNQLLTNVQLNQLRQYLDEQNRLTRIRLVGMGIVCGLTAETEGMDDAGEAGMINLSRGYGVTSDGYLIEIPAPSLVPPLPEGEANEEEEEECPPGITLVNVRAYYDPYLEPDTSGRMIPVYEPWRLPEGEIDPDDPDAPTQIPILELLTQEQLDHPAFVEEVDNISAPLTAVDLEGRVLVLYLEFDPKNLKSCLTTDCTNKGQNLHLNVRALLVPEEYLITPEPCSGLDQLIEVPRLYHGLKKTANLDYLEEVNSSDQIDAAYADLSAYVREQLLNLVPTAFVNYRSLLDIAGLETLVDDLDNLLPDVTNPQSVNQYYYDFYKDLADAYNEFTALICSLVQDCCQPCDFPRHLMIRSFDPPQNRVDPYRHRFVPSPVRNVLYDDLRRAEKMFERILCLAGNFDLPSPARTPVKITPSQPEKHPMQDRALPYYYDFPEVEDCWQPKGCCSPQVLSYYQNDMAAPGNAYLSLPDHPLTLNINKNDLWRIEGHWGRSCGEAVATIRDLRKRHNLEFDLRPLTLEAGLAAAAVADPLVEEMGKLLKLIELLQQQIVDQYTSGNPDQETIEALQKQIQEAQERLDSLSGEWVEKRKTSCAGCDLSFLRSDYLLLRSKALCTYKNIQKLLSQLPEFGLPTEQEACLTFDEEPPEGTTFEDENLQIELSTSAGTVQMTTRPFFGPDGNPILGSGQIQAATAQFGSGNLLLFKGIGFRFDFNLSFTPDEVRLEVFHQGQLINLSVNADQGAAPSYVGTLAGLPGTIAPGVSLIFTRTSPNSGLISLQGPVNSLVIGGDALLMDNLCARSSTGLDTGIGMVAGSMNKRKSVLDNQIKSVQSKIKSTSSKGAREKLSAELNRLQLERKNIDRAESAIRMSGDLATRLLARFVPGSADSKVFRNNAATSRSLAIETGNPVTLVLLGVFFGIAYLRNYLEKMTGNLPKDVCAFNYYLFIHAYKEVIGVLIEFQLLLSLLLEYLWVAFGTLEGLGTGPYFQKVITQWIFRNLTPISDYLNAFNKIRFNCLHAEFATLFYTLEHLAGNRIGSFQDFARAHPGLEHLAGVEKGGTFVVLCERGDNNEPVVVADFALRGSNCCCDLSVENLCLPPIAKPDYRIINLGKDEANQANVLIDVLANDYGLNESPNLRIEEVPEETAGGLAWRSRLGGFLEIVEDENGRQRIRYSRPESRTALDSFRYRLVDDACGLSDEAEVYLLLRPASETPLVTVEHYAATSQDQSVDVDIMMSSFWNLQSLGTNYTLTSGGNSAMQGTIVVKTVVIQNQTRQIFEYQPPEGFTGQDFFLYNLNGNGQTSRGMVRVLVAPCCTESSDGGPSRVGPTFSGAVLIDGEPFPGINILMTNQASGQTFGAATNIDGNFTFSDLPTGKYQLRTSVPGTQSRSVEIVVVPNGPKTLPPIDLGSGRVNPGGIVSGNDLARLVDLARTRSGASVEDAVTRVDETFRERLALRRNTLEKLGADATLARSKSYQRVTNFIAKIVTDQQKALEQIAEEFRKETDALLSSLKRAGEDRRSQYEQLLATMTMSYLDRLVATQPEGLSREQQEILANFQEKLQAAGLETKEISKRWQGRTLEKELGITTWKTVNKILN